MINRSERYIKNILSGKVYHGQYVLKAVQNLEKDRVNSERWEYDEALANKYIRFIEKLFENLFITLVFFKAT
jgi:hypothetical protein